MRRDLHCGHFSLVGSPASRYLGRTSAAAGTVLALTTPKLSQRPPLQASERFAQELDLSRRRRVGGRWWLPSFAASLSRQVPAEDLLQLFLAELLRVCPCAHAQHRRHGHSFVLVNLQKRFDAGPRVWSEWLKQLAAGRPAAQKK